MIRVLSVVFAGVLLSSCGDMSELQEDELREFIRKAKRVVTDELFSDYDDEQIETVESVLVEVLTEDEELEEDEEDTVVASNRCREVGRKTVFSAKDLPFAELSEDTKVNLSAKSDGLECSAEGSEVLTTCMKGACSCSTRGQVDSSSNNYQADCIDSAIRGANREKSFSYSEEEVAEYGDNLPDFPDTITSSDQESYRLVISPTTKELALFSVSIIGATADDTQTLTDDKDKSIYVYDNNDQRLTDKLARWPSKVGDDIFDLQIEAGNDANFEVFLVRDARQTVKTIAGYVDEELSAITFNPAAQDRSTTMQVAVYQRNTGGVSIFEFSANPDPGPLPTGSNAGIDLISVNENGIVSVLGVSGSLQMSTQELANGTVRISTNGFACQLGDTVYVRVNRDIYQSSCTQGQ